MVKLSLEMLSGRSFYYFKAITNFDNLKQDKIFTQMEYLRQRMRLKQWQAHGLVEQIYQTLSQPSPDLDIRALVQVEKDLSYNFGQMYQAVKDANLGFYSAEINKQVTQLAQGFRSVRDGINRDLKRYRYTLNLWDSSAFTTRDMFEEAVQVKMDSVQLEESERYAFAQKLSLFHQHQALTDTQQIKRFSIYIVKQLTTLVDLESPSIACAIEVSQGAN